MKLNKATVLVTGGGGFIGSHLVERLAKVAGKTKTLVPYNARGTCGWLQDSPVRGDVEVILGDVRDGDALRETMRNVDVVFHLAALIAIPYSYRAPRSYVETNITGTLNVLQAARELGTGLVVHTSTSEVYGTARSVPISESHPLQGQSPYSASKIGADKLAESFHLAFGLPVVTVRPFNTFGPRQSMRAVIPTVICQALAGEVIRLGSVSPTRDFNFVANTVDGFISVVEQPNAIGQTINFGSGREIRIDKLVEVIGQQLGGELRVEVEQERLRPERSEVERLLADNSRARTVLGWEPRVTLEDGLKQTIAWFRDNRERYQEKRYVI